jgi:two-component system, cell cycle sensor histidine kinase and response regulator CckA
VRDNSSILVVDDEAHSLSLLRGILTAEGYQVRLADSGKLALASLTAWLPQLIVLDVRMKDMDGFEVLRQIKASEKARNIPVIFITAASETEERLRGLALGAVDYITKPFQREELLARVRTHLELSRLRDQLEEQVRARTAELSAALDRLRESEQRFRSVADKAPVMIWMSDIDKRCTFVNKTWLTFTGRTLEEEQGDGWRIGLHPDDLDRCFGIYSSAFDARQDFHVEYRLRRTDGEFRHVVDNGAPLFAPSGAFTGYIGSAVDITDLKKVHEEALSREKLQSLTALTRGIAHDFNNMVGAIMAQAELAEIDVAEGLVPRDKVHQIKATAIRASEVVRELMIYSGQEETELGAVDLSELVEEMSELMKIPLTKCAKLQLDLARGIPYVCGNAVQIRQLVMNLIINAAQAIGTQEGFISVQTSLLAGKVGPSRDDGADAGDGWIRLTVADTGCGMTEEQKSKIFDPFFTTRPQGHGLGLAVVQGIVRSHKGAISVVSAPGRGTTFEVLFRRAQGHSQSAPATSVANTAPEHATNAGLVLLVEDEEVLRRATATALQKKGFFVLSVGDGRTAVEAFEARAQEIDVAVLDWTLPGLSGKEVFRRIRAIKPEVRVIFTSAYGPKVVDVPMTDQPTVTFLQKPYTFAEVLREIQAHPKRNDGGRAAAVRSA